MDFCLTFCPQGARLCRVNGRETGAVTSSECGEAWGRLGLAGCTQICALTDNHLDTVKHHRELEIQVPSTPGLMVLGGEIRN